MWGLRIRVFPPPELFGFGTGPSGSKKIPLNLRGKKYSSVEVWLHLFKGGYNINF